MSRFTDLFQSPAPEPVKEVKVEKVEVKPTHKVVSTKTKKEESA